MSATIEYVVAFQWDKKLVGSLWLLPNWFRLIWNKPNGVFIELGGTWVLSYLNNATTPTVVKTGDWFILERKEDGVSLISSNDYDDWCTRFANSFSIHHPNGIIEDRRVSATIQKIVCFEPLGRKV